MSRLIKDGTTHDTMDTAKSGAQFRLPPLPPLRNRDPDNYVPLLVFAFPLPDKHLVKWAKAHITSPETDEWNLECMTWDEVRRRPPQQGCCRATAVYYDGGKPAPALMIASNRSEKEMMQAQDVELVQVYRDFLDTDPEWCCKFRC